MANFKNIVVNGSYDLQASGSDDTIIVIGTAATTLGGGTATLTVRPSYLEATYNENLDSGVLIAGYQQMVVIGRNMTLGVTVAGATSPVIGVMTARTSS